MNKRKRFKDTMVMIIILAIDMVLLCADVSAGTPYTGSQTRFFRSVDDNVTYGSSDYPNTDGYDHTRLSCG